MPNKLAIIYHCKDMDGLLSATLLKNFYKDIYSITMVPYNYEKEGIEFIKNQENFIKSFNEIIFVDVTPSVEWLENYMNLCDKNHHLTIIDHHEKQLKDLMQAVTLNETFMDIKQQLYFEYPFLKNILLYNIGHYINSVSFKNDNSNKIDFFFSHIKNNELPVSAAWLSYLYVLYFEEIVLQSKKERLNKLYNISYFVWLVSEYDVWNFNTPNYNKEQKQKVINFQLEINEIIKEFLNKKEYDNIINLLENNLFYNKINSIDKWINEIINKGSIIYKEKLENQKFKTNYFLVKINRKFNIYDNKKFIIVIGEYPEFIVQDWFKEKYDDISAFIFMRIKPDENIVTLSIRQGNYSDFNCINFVQYLTGSGGGHFAATGGAIKHTELIEFLSNNFESI